MEQLLQILDAIEQYSASTWITLVGLVLFYIGVKPIFSEESAKVKTTYIFAGVIIIVIAQILSFSNSFIERKITANQAFENLVENKRVQWVMRLISYNEKKESFLALDKIKKLGKPDHEYVFVSDYEELINYTVTEAIYKMGGTRKGMSRASAIIFPLEHGELFPANARGLLQVAQKVDQKHIDDNDYKSFKFQDNLTSDEISDLSKMSRSSWGWNAYSAHYTGFKQAATTFRNGDYTALNYIGSLNKDWSEFGYSRVIGLDIDDAATEIFSLQAQDGTDYKVSNFGARAFLIENHEIKNISNRVLIDFSDLDKQRIPDFRGKFATLPTL